MKPKTIAAAALAITLAAPVDAAPIELDLTFSGLTATFYGLHDDVAGAQVATSFDFTGALDTYTVAIANPLSPPINPVNGFTFVGGPSLQHFLAILLIPTHPVTAAPAFLLH